MSTYAEILSAALSLPPHERTELAEVLLESTDDKGREPEISAEWRDEIARRSAAYVRGELKGIPWSQVRDEIRRKYQGNA
jgi:putative addiction module component (TIGR02574 family)